jgi:amidase
MTLLDGSAVEQARAIRDGRLSSVELVRAYLARIEARNPVLQAFVEIAPKHALQQAARKDAELRRNRSSLPPFHGVPIGIKDLNFVRGFGMRGGSRALRWLKWSPIDDRTAAALRRGGFVFVGKLATSEAGAMPVTEPDIHPPVRNPWNLEHTAGGSSGGSGAAVSGGLLPVAQGSDGAGSVRIPAAFCHLFGLKPSRGRLANQFGLRDRRILYTCGPITRTVADAAAMLDVMLDRDPSSPAPRSDAPFAELAERTPPRLRIRVATRAPWGTTNPEIEAATLRVARVLEELGHHLEPAPQFQGALADGLPLWQWLVGSAPLPLRYVQPVTRWLAEPGRRMVRADRDLLHDALAKQVLDTFGDADLWLTPTVIVPPPRVGVWKDLAPEAAFTEAAVLGAFTAFFNVSGQPAVSVPAGLTTDGLPIGVQLAGRLFDEATVLAVARELEQRLPWRERKPPLS